MIFLSSKLQPPAVEYPSVAAMEPALSISIPAEFDANAWPLLIVNKRSTVSKSVDDVVTRLVRSVLPCTVRLPEITRSSDLIYASAINNSLTVYSYYLA